MAHGIVVKTRTASTEVDAYNRPAVAGSAVNLDNGNVFRLDTQSGSAGYAEVWDVSAPSGSTVLSGLWMAASPERVITVSGTYEFANIDPDPRNFYNIGGKVFDAFKPVAGDILLLTSDAISGSPSTGDYVCAGSGVYQLAWSATQTASALAMKILKETSYAIGSGAIGGTSVLACKLQVLAN